MRHRVGMPLGLVAQRHKRVARVLPAGRHHDWIHGAMSEEYRRVFIADMTLGGCGVGQGKITRQTDDAGQRLRLAQRSEEHTSELQSLMRISYAVFCLKKKNTK